MYTSIITRATKAIIQETGEEFLDVEFDISDGEEVIDTKKAGFPIDTDSDAIVAELKKYTANYEAEKIAAVENAARDAALAEADATIEELVGLEIVPDAPEEDLTINE